MSPENFCYWLQGAFELGKTDFSEKDIQNIRNHLELVFNKVTPNLNTMSDRVMPNIYCKSTQQASIFPKFDSPVSC